MDKESVKDLICKAIDNIPNCAEIVDCYTQHGFADTEAYMNFLQGARYAITLKNTSTRNVV